MQITALYCRCYPRGQTCRDTPCPPAGWGNSPKAPTTYDMPSGTSDLRKKMRGNHATKSATFWGLKWRDVTDVLPGHQGHQQLSHPLHGEHQRYRSATVPGPDSFQGPDLGVTQTSNWNHDWTSKDPSKTANS